MKKLAIAGASAVLAALPVVGVFAATSSSFTDTLTVTVPGGCTLEDNSAQNPGTYADRSFSASVPAGTVGYLNDDGEGTQTGTTMKIQCNQSTGTWTVTAVASTGALAGSGTAAGETIAPGAGTITSGNTSGWSIQSNASGATTNPYASYKAYEVDSGETYSTFLTGSASATNVTFNPSYRVYVSPSQKPGNYEGTVTYTVAMD